MFLNTTLQMEHEVAMMADRSPSDQYLLGYSLQSIDNADVARATFLIPMMWANEFWLDYAEGSQEKDGIGWTPPMQIHLCNYR